MSSMQKTLIACAIASFFGLAAGGAPADEKRSYTVAGKSFPARGCTIRGIAGKWLFATSIGRQMLPQFPAEKDITAIGTMIIQPDGTVTGTFDVAVEDTVFLPGVGYAGSIVVNRDCTGTLSFVNEFGAARTDSIAIVGRGELLGMSQDPNNLWTYQARRVGSLSRRDD